MNNMPMEINTPDNARYEVYEDLLVRRDQLYKEAGSYMTVYTAEFGELITSNFELKIECIKKKKTIGYCQSRINRGIAIDTTLMQAEIEQEMKLYYVQLQGMISDTEKAKNAECSSEFRFNRSKKLYRRLAKLIHPDINKKTERDETLKDLWTRIVKAYQINDADELEDLEVLVRKALEVLGDEGFEPHIDDIEERIERVERQINEILTTEPYTYGEILGSEEKRAELRKQLQEEHDEYEQYLAELTKILDDILREGGASLVWKMK
jgi:iron-sulfur cluster repair protein YtfE (RIC family)